MIAASPLSGCPLAKPATPILRWSSEGKGTTIEATLGIVMCQWGVAMMYRPTGHKGPSPQRHKPTNGTQRIVPSSSQPSRPSGATNVGWTTAIDTHNLARTIVPKMVAPPLTPAVYQGPDIATVWTCPTPVYTHTARRCTNNTQGQGHRAVCPSATHMSTK